MKKLYRPVAAAIALGALLTPLTARPATALEGEPIVIRAEEGATFAQDYGAIPVSDTLGALTHPGDCAVSPGCMEIPLTVVLPDDYDPEDEFFFNFLASWVNVDVGGEAGSTDLDFYIWVERPNEEGEMEWVEAGSAASASQPERARLFGFTERDYVITAVNFYGANTGFRIEMDFVDLSLPDDFDPYAGTTGRSGSSGTAGSSDAGGTDSSTGGDFGTSSGGALDLTPTAPAPTSPSSLAPVGIDGFSAGFTATPGDPGLGDFGSFNQFQKELNAEAEPTSIDLLAASRRQLGPASDVGAPVLFFWLLALPLAVAATAYVMLARRRPAALTVSV